MWGRILIAGIVLCLMAGCGAKTHFVQQGRASYPRLVDRHNVVRVYRDDLEKLEKVGAGVIGWIHEPQKDANTGELPKWVAILASKNGGTHVVNVTWADSSKTGLEANLPPYRERGSSFGVIRVHSKKLADLPTVLQPNHVLPENERE